jgi:hypothetical protein
VRCRRRSGFCCGLAYTDLSGIPGANSASARKRADLRCPSVTHVGRHAVRPGWPRKRRLCTEPGPLELRHRGDTGASFQVRRGLLRPINDELRTVLGALPSRLKIAWVFPSVSGKTPLDAKNYMNRVFVPALKRARLENSHWHDLRHTFASRLVMKGVDLRTVQELMGHKTIAMTLSLARPQARSGAAVESLPNRHHYRHRDAAFRWSGTARRASSRYDCGKESGRPGLNPRRLAWE